VQQVKWWDEYSHSWPSIAEWL